MKDNNKAGSDLVQKKDQTILNLEKQFGASVDEISAAAVKFFMAVQSELSKGNYVIVRKCEGLKMTIGSADKKVFDSVLEFADE